MRYRVKITEAPEVYKVKLVEPPKAKTGYQVEGSLANDLSAFGGGNLKLTEPKAVSRTTITKVPREEANLEAEGGETVLTFDPSGYPLFYEIKGPRHSANGVPLNLPDDSFIFSDTKSMMIKDPAILKMFNKAPKKGGYTPADLSKQFISLNKYRMTLQNADSDKIDTKTAELMIKKALIKLGALALAQEAKKGFPQGIPAVAKQYMEANNISEEDILPDTPNQEPEAEQGQAMDMGQAMAEGAPEQAMEANQEAPTMPDGSPVAMPEEMQGAPEGLPPGPGMRYGGRTLRKAAEGLAAALGEVTQRVEAALEAGQPLEEVLVGLLKNNITPVDILDILNNLGIPEVKGKELVTQALDAYQQMAAQQQQAAPQQGPPMGEPGMQGQPSPEEMMAMAQQMPQEQMQQAPMAQYGMSMGGYNMPFYSDPNEMAYGGVPLRKAGNGETVKGKKGDVEARRAKDKSEFESHKGAETTTSGGKKAKYLYTQGEIEGKAKVQTRAEREAQGRGARGGPGYTAADVCRWVSDPNNKNYYGWTGQQAFDAGLIDKSNIATIDGCAKKVQDAAMKEEAIYIDDEGQPVVQPEIIEEEECVCVDPMTKQETVFPKNADGTCEPCKGYQMEEAVQPQQKAWSGSAELPEDRLNLGIALAGRYANTPPVMGKAPGVRENAWGTDYMGQAELLKGMTAGTQSNIGKVAANNPAGAIAAMIAAGRGAQGDVITLASQNNADNALRSTALNKANTAHQWNQLLLDKDTSDVYNKENATWHHNKAQDFTNWMANVGDKYATLKGGERMLKAVNASTGMKWDPQLNDYVNTNNKVITPEKPEETFQDKLARFQGMGLAKNQDALKAMELEMRMNNVKRSRLGGASFAKGGYVYGDIMYPFIL
jgi:hypothetical protein